MDIKNCRSLYPGCNDKIFLDSACVGLIPFTAQQKVIEFMNMALRCDAKDSSEHHIKMDALKEDALHSVQKLFNTSIDQVCFIESTTHGLNIAANAIDFKADDEVIICDTEYLQVAIPFVKLAEKKNIKITPLITPANSIIEIDHFTKLINKKTKAICISAVQWCTGQRIFKSSLGDLCKQNNIWLIIDGVQEAGALNIDVNERYCDFYISGGHKWLNSPYGCGIMYMSKRALTLEPSSFGYLNLPAPANGWGSYFRDRLQTPFRDYNFPKSARSFSIGGTSNYPGAIGLKEAIDIVLSVGVKTIEKQVLFLSRYLKSRLRNMGFLVIGNDSDEDQSGITMFSFNNDYDKDHALLNYLLEKRILISQRYTNGHGGLRISTHYFNNERDIEILCEALQAFKKGTPMTKMPKDTVKVL